MGSFLSSSSSHQAEDNACISQEDLNESIDLALAVAMSVQPSEEAPPTSDWLRLCQQCGQLSYIRQGCCLNTLCSLSYMAVDPATLGHRLQSWGSPDGSAVASPQKLEEQRIRRLQQESQGYKQQRWKKRRTGSKGVKAKQWNDAMKSGYHPKTGKDLSLPVKWQGEWWKWESSCGWRRCTADEIPGYAPGTRESPPWRDPEVVAKQRAAAEEAQAAALKRQAAAKEEAAARHKAEANIGRATSAFPPRDPRFTMVAPVPVKAKPVLQPELHVLQGYASELQRMLMQALLPGHGFLPAVPPKAPGPIYMVNPKSPALPGVLMPPPPKATVEVPGDTTDEEIGEDGTKDD